QKSPCFITKHGLFFNLMEDKSSAFNYLLREFNGKNTANSL
ncbi:MAG: hypothetical protein ACI901_001091, partial [Octadecabacter sp.]